MIYVIGGAPRCGKTKLAKKISKKLGIPIFSTDVLRVEVLNKTPKNKINIRFPFEEMFCGDQVDECFKNYEPVDFLNADKREARTLIGEIKMFFRDKIKQGEDYIIEGVHLLPKYIDALPGLNKEFKVIYLGKLNEEKIMKGLCLNRDKNDWILGHIKRKVTIKRAAAMVCVYGKYFEKESGRFNFEYVNTEDNFINKINIICKKLIES
jgi:2-phosphoglycerate kinase